MRKWILRFGTGAGLVLTSTLLSGCLFPEKPKQPINPRTQPANNGSANGNQPFYNNNNSSTNNGTANPGPGTTSRTSGMGADPAGRLNVATPTNRDAPHVPAAVGQQALNNGIQPAGNSVILPGEIPRTPLATSNGNSGKNIIIPNVASGRGPTARDQDRSAQPDDLPIKQPPPPVTMMNGDQQLERLPRQNPPLMDRATEVQSPIRPINPGVK